MNATNSGANSSLKALIREKTQVQMTKLIAEKQERKAMRATQGDGASKVKTTNLINSKAAGSIKQTLKQDLKARISTDLMMNKRQPTSPQVTSVRKINRQVVQPAPQFVDETEYGLDYLPPDLFRKGIVSYLLHPAPMFPGHYSERRKGMDDVKELIDMGYFAQPNNNVNIYTESDMGEGTKFLTVYIGSLPSTDIFKLACLNKSYNRFIMNLFKPLKIKNFRNFFETMECVEMLRVIPDFSRYINL
jgi:hypothetical protein